LTIQGIADLRHFAGEIKTGEHTRSVLILPSLRRFASKFSTATGIKVRVDAKDDMIINDRLAAEIFQMVTEGLSNVRRHTTAQAARAEITIDDVNLILRIENENRNGCAPVLFHPRSLADRAISLGGQLSVSINDDHLTVVTIQIPL
jgi:signal transduction histidine kinase